MFKAYYYGLPTSAVKLAREGFAQIYGAEDVVRLSEVPAAKIKLQSHLSATRNDVVAFIVPDGYADSGRIAPSIVSTDKYIPYSTDARLVEALNARGAKLDAPTGEQPLDPTAFMQALATFAAAQGANTVVPQQVTPTVAPAATSPNADMAHLQAELDAANQKLAEQEALLNTRASESDRIAALEADATRLAREKADLEKQVMHGGSDMELRKRLAAFERSSFARLDAFSNADSILTLSLPTVATLSPVGAVVAPPGAASTGLVGSMGLPVPSLLLRPSLGLSGRSSGSPSPVLGGSRGFTPVPLPLRALGSRGGTLGATSSLVAGVPSPGWLVSSRAGFSGAVVPLCGPD